MTNPQALVSDVSGLLSLPEVYLRIRNLLDDPAADMSDFAAAVGMDPNISIQVLKMANSAFFGFATKIESLSRAINIMGIARLHDLVLGISSVKSFSKIENAVVDTDLFWRKSIGCGISARLLATRCNALDSDRLFVAGLLHDIGHLLLYHQLPELSRQAIDLSLEEQIPLYQIERRLIGFDYGQVGRELMRVWNLPESYQETTACHMEPGKAMNFQLETSIIHLARQISFMMIAPQDAQFQEPIDSIVWPIIGLSDEVINLIAEEANKLVLDVVHLIQSH